MKLLSSLPLLLLAVASLASAEVIDVNIKGMDDGVKTNRQQDYREAVMNAKLQAIEQAGASIESITQVANFQLRYDAVESKSQAVLLPGFQIIDIGYVADGTYQVVLTGKVQTGGPGRPAVAKAPPAPAAKEIKRDGRFIAYDNWTVLDTRTNLMWAAMDNGEDINWTSAKAYCENYRDGGYTDWRMPTQNELAGLYDSSKSYRAPRRGYEVKLTELIQISVCCPWAAETRGPEAAAFSFWGNGDRYWIHKSVTTDYRVLPVRSVK